MTDTANTATGIAGAADSIEALLAGGSPELNAPELQEALSKAPAEEIEAEAFEGEIDGDETADVSEEVEAAPEDEAAAEDETEDDAESEVPLYTVKVNGKEEQVPVDELVKGYQRQADYSRKTAALAEERRAFEGERQQVTTERTQYAQLLTALSQQLEQLQPQEPDWQRLLDTDPVMYMREKELWNDRQNKLAAANFELQRVQSMQAQEQRSQLAALVNENRQKLVEAVPQWKDPKKWDVDKGKILEYGRRIGFSDEELDQTYDSRAVVALYKAMRYDELTAKKPQPVVNKGPKTAAPGSANTVPKKSVTEVTAAKKRLAQTGKVADAAVLFQGFID